MPIQAECHSDDHIVETDFDAEPWFIQATNDEITKLACCRWGSDYPADEVAVFIAGVNQSVKRVFIYFELVAHKKDHPGFECSIETESAMAWIAQHRPQLGAYLQMLKDLAAKRPETVL